MKVGTGEQGTRLTMLAAAAVLVLAVLAVLLPRRDGSSHAVSLLVFDPAGEAWRTEQVHRPLAEFLAAVIEQPVSARSFREAEALTAAAADGEGFVLAPDGLILRLAAADYVPVAAVRRSAPRNLRPRGVLVHRTGHPVPAAPWLTHSRRTVLGDSLCLSSVGAWMLDADAPAPLELPACGPDPYDHRPVLHALRLGGFDYALVRQWDAERFLAAGLLDPAEWTVTPMTAPVPDLVLAAPRSMAAARLLEVGESLRRLGRESDAAPAGTEDLLRGLERLGLAGFNPLMEPDLDRLRRRWRRDWPPGGG